MQRLWAYIVYCFCEYKGHAINEIDELWQQISPRWVFRTGRNLAVDRDGLAICHHPDWWTVVQGVALGRQNTEGCKKIVTLFSYIVWPSAMKFGMVRGLANRYLFPEFRELWSGCTTKPCIVGTSISHRWCTRVVVYCTLYRVVPLPMYWYHSKGIIDCATTCRWQL